MISDKIMKVLLLVIVLVIVIYSYGLVTRTEKFSSPEEMKEINQLIKDTIGDEITLKDILDIKDAKKLTSAQIKKIIKLYATAEKKKKKLDNKYITKKNRIIQEHLKK